MTDFQPVQQKPETADAHAEFERGLEEFMRGHLDDCMSFASCSSSRAQDDEDDESDQLVRRRRRNIKSHIQRMCLELREREVAYNVKKRRL